jgi:signal transduction histidine kinase
VTVADNGTGIAPEVVARILDYSTLTSDKALYR